MNLDIRELVGKGLFDSPREKEIGVEEVDQDVGNFVVPRRDRQSLDTLAAQGMPAITAKVKLTKGTSGGRKRRR